MDDMNRAKERARKRLYVCLCAVMVIYTFLANYNYIYASQTDAAASHAKIADTEITAIKTEEQVYFERTIEALASEDMEAFAQLWPDGAEQEALDAIMEGWGGEKVISYTKIGEEKRPAQGDQPEGTIYQYQVQCENMDADITICWFSEDDGTLKIDFFNAKTNYHIQENPSPAREIFIGLAVIEFLLSVYTTTHCLENRKTHPVLWTLFIMLVYGGIVISHTPGFYIGIKVSRISMSKLRLWKGGMDLIISFPLGVPVYWISAKSRKKAAKLRNGDAEETGLQTEKPKKEMTERQKKKALKQAQKQKYTEMAEQWYQEEERRRISSRPDDSEK